MANDVFTREQVIAMGETVKQICLSRGINPLSEEGQRIAVDVIKSSNGGEALYEISRRLRLH